MDNRYHYLTVVTLALALLVIMMGAYTRLSDAGLGCPDWPGCYGKLVLPTHQTKLAQAQKTFPNQPIILEKAWKEMAHRYCAGLLGLLIVTLAIWSFFRKRHRPQTSLLVPGLLASVVAFQVILGMWTVTMKVIPIVVMGHLMGGMTIAALLCWLMMSSQSKPHPISPYQNSLRPWVIFGLVIVVVQIFLGAWTSTNYAALACPNFPFCHGSLFPPLDWRNAFDFTSPIGPNYEGGHLAMKARITLQMVHRYGAFLTLAYWIPFSLLLIIKKKASTLRRFGWAILGILLLQFLLGAINVIKLLPTPIAVGHNGVAAIFLITLVALLYTLGADHTEFQSPKTELR